MENETLKDTVLQLAALSGEVSEEALRYLDCSDKYLTNLLLQLRNDEGYQATMAAEATANTWDSRVSDILNTLNGGSSK